MIIKEEPIVSKFSNSLDKTNKFLSINKIEVLNNKRNKDTRGLFKVFVTQQ